VTGHVAQVDAAQAGIHAQLPRPLERRDRRWQRPETVGRVIAGDVPRGVRPQVGRDALCDGAQGLLLVVHARDHQRGQLHPDALLVGVLRVAPHHLHIGPAVAQHRPRAALNVDVHGVQPGLNEQLERRLRHVTVGDKGIVEPRLVRPGEEVQ